MCVYFRLLLRERAKSNAEEWISYGMASPVAYEKKKNSHDHPLSRNGNSPLDPQLPLFSCSWTKTTRWLSETATHHHHHRGGAHYYQAAAQRRAAAATSGPVIVAGGLCQGGRANGWAKEAENKEDEAE